MIAFAFLLIFSSFLSQLVRGCPWMLLDMPWRYCFGTQGAGWNHKWLWRQMAVKGRWLNTSSHDWDLWNMQKFPIFLWHTVTSARVKTAQKRLLLALPGSYFLKTLGWPGYTVQFFGHVLTVNCPFAAMSCEVQLNTLQGDVITLDVVMTATVRELKAMLLEKHPCQDPIERKVLKVELLRDSSIIDDAETLEAAGLLGAESLVTVTYTRNEVEAATKRDIRTQGWFAVKIPSNVTNICEAAFKNSHQLVLLTIPESVTHIGECAFQNCTSLASITLGASATQIGHWAFHGCASLASITSGESVTHIGQWAFHGCASLASITLGESVTHIGDHAFHGCASLARITLGESVTHIGDAAFRGCTSLASITLRKSVTRIGNYAFTGCTSLASATLDEAVTHIGEGAFQNCSSLASITLGESVTHIGDGAFCGCTSLASITLGEAVTHIGECAFQNCRSLASITLGESVTRIGNYAFAGCTSLASITLGEAVTHIGEGAFQNCRSLASITIPESLRHTLMRVLGSVSVAVVTIPARQGRKRLREEWVSVQICSGATWPLIGTTCEKTSACPWCDFTHLWCSPYLGGVSCFTPMGSVSTPDATKQDSWFNLFSTQMWMWFYIGECRYIMDYHGIYLQIKDPIPSTLLHVGSENS